MQEKKGSVANRSVCVKAFFAFHSQKYPPYYSSFIQKAFQTGKLVEYLLYGWSHVVFLKCRDISFCDFATRPLLYKKNWSFHPPDKSYLDCYIIHTICIYILYFKITKNVNKVRIVAPQACDRGTKYSLKNKYIFLLFLK